MTRQLKFSVGLLCLAAATALAANTSTPAAKAAAPAAAKPASAAAAKQAAAWDEMDGPLVDYEKKGTRVALAGTESVDGHDCYQLKLTLKDGQVRNVWVDGKTFMERKMDGEPRRIDGRLHPVS